MNLHRIKKLTKNDINTLQNTAMVITPINSIPNQQISRQLTDQFESQNNKYILPPLKHKILTQFSNGQTLQLFDKDNPLQKRLSEPARYSYIKKIHCSDINQTALATLEPSVQIKKLSPLGRRFQKLTQRGFNPYSNNFEQLKNKYKTISISEPHQPQFLKKQYSRFLLQAHGDLESNNTKSKHFFDYEFAKKRKLKQMLKINKMQYGKFEFPDSKQKIRMNEIFQKHDSFIPTHKKRSGSIV